MIRALTLTQPWATAVAVGAKRIETRSWSTRYRGELLIHAAAGKPDRHLEGRLRWPGDLSDVLLEWPRDGAPLGVIVARCRLIDVVWTDDLIYGPAPIIAGGRRGSHEWPLDDREMALGDYSDGRYAWLLDDVEPIDPPIPARGALGLWIVPDTIRLPEPTRGRVDSGSWQRPR